MKHHPLQVIVAVFLGTVSLAVGISGCRGVSRVGPPARQGTEIMVAGQLFDIGTPVVLWDDPDGYNAYSEVPRFEAPARDESGRPITRRRYGPRSHLPTALEDRVTREGWTPELLSRVVQQFVLHYDVAGVSRQCFKILQDRRNLSVHFMLDVDGTIYQTLDLQERAWHAGASNDRSVGIEIAQIGAHPAPGHPAMRSWYRRDEAGLRLRVPKWIGDPGIRTPDFVARPERQELIEGEIRGKRYWQYDYTAAQREALSHLAAGLHRVLRIPLEVPRAPDGEVRMETLDAAEQAAFRGILGHLHVSERKIDPGPAMDWERLLREARRLDARR